MLRKSGQQLQIQGVWSGFAMPIAQFLAPGLIRDALAVQNTYKVERGIRLQTIVKANKVDLRALLALPVTDPAHPYKAEYPWEKVASHMDHRNSTLYGKIYRAKVLAAYESCYYHRFGAYMDDMLDRAGWHGRAAMMRCPAKIIVHGHRRVQRANSLNKKFLFLPKVNWVKPTDNTKFFNPYMTMILDEWEEKWGFFAGQEVEF